MSPYRGRSSRRAGRWWVAHAPLLALLFSVIFAITPARAERIADPVVTEPTLDTESPAVADAAPATERAPATESVPVLREETVPTVLSPMAVAGVPLADGSELVLGPDDKAAIPENSAAAAAFKRLRPAERLTATSDTDRRLSLILAHERRGDLQSALQAAVVTLAAAPDHRHLRRLTAQLQVALGRHAEVLQTLAPLLEIDDSDWAPFFWAGVAELMQGHHTSARVYLERATQLDSDRVEPWMARAIVEQETGNHAAALQLLEVARQRSPADAQLLLNIGYSHEKLGHAAAAIQNYEASRSLAGRPPDQTASGPNQGLAERILRLSGSRAVSISD